MTVVITGSTVAAMAVLAVGGCGSNGNKEQHLFTVKEATRIATVRPAVKGWKWPKTPEQPASPAEASKPGGTDPLLARFRRQTSSLVDFGEKGNTWQDNDKLGNLDVGVYATASDAHRAFAPFNALSLGLARRTGTVTKAERVDDLGDEAWRLWVAGNGTQATYHWRQGNLVVETHVHCYGHCPGEVDTAARSWADVIDETAHSEP